MAQMFEAKAPSTADVQDAFLNVARRSRATVTLSLMDGSSLEARIKSFDRFAVIVEHDSSETMVFKHAIASIRGPRGTAATDAGPSA